MAARRLTICPESTGAPRWTFGAEGDRFRGYYNVTRVTRTVGTRHTAPTGGTCGSDSGRRVRSTLAVLSVFPAIGDGWLRRTHRACRIHAARPRRRAAMDQPAGLPGRARAGAARARTARRAARHVPGLRACRDDRR